MIIRKLIPAAEVEIMIGTVSSATITRPRLMLWHARASKSPRENSAKRETTIMRALTRSLAERLILERFDVVLKADEAHRAAR